MPVNIIIGTPEENMGFCEYCGGYDELRPYGKLGARICFDCGMKPENKETTEAQFNKILNPTQIEKARLN